MATLIENWIERQRKFFNPAESEISNGRVILYGLLDLITAPALYITVLFLVVSCEAPGSCEGFKSAYINFYINYLPVIVGLGGLASLVLLLFKKKVIAYRVAIIPMVILFIYLVGFLFV
jgi:hypothetical protein